MNEIEVIQKAVDWVRNNMPQARCLTVCVCSTSGYKGLPEVNLHANKVSRLFPGSECHFIRDRGCRRMGYYMVVKNGVVIRSFDLCGENDEDRKFIIPYNDSENVAEVL